MLCRHEADFALQAHVECLTAVRITSCSGGGRLDPKEAVSLPNPLQLTLYGSGKLCLCRYGTIFYIQGVHRTLLIA